MMLDGQTSPVSEVVSTCSMDAGKYAWAGEPGLAWDWNEDVWCQRLFHSIKATAVFK